MATLPVDTPVTIPVLLPTNATPALLLLHVPPATASPTVSVCPTQVTPEPVMAGVEDPTVIGAVEVHPVGPVKVTMVLPADNPVTTPELLIMATPVLGTDHVPPVIVSANVVVPPVQTAVPPLIPGEQG